MNTKILSFLKKFIEKNTPFIARLYRNIRDNRKYYEEPKIISLGFKFNGNAIMESGKFEPAETQTVINTLNQVDSVINIGANIGYYCCIAAHNNKNVIAFEPVAQNIKYLLRNIKANNWQKKIEVFPIALSNEIGLVDIFGSGTGASLVSGWSGVSNSYKNLVPASKLDIILSNRFLEDRLLIIIDVEGSELQALKGAHYFLDRKVKPIWMVEISSDDHQPESNTINPNLLETFKMFFDRGYIAKTVEASPKTVNINQITEIMKTKEITLTSHNFLFFDPEINL